MSKMSKKTKERHFKTIGDHKQFLERITKSLYYGKLPSTERLSLPVTELAAELFSEPQHGRSLDRLHYNDAAKISRNACISPCSLVLAILYLEQLKTCNPEYLQQIAPSELFLVSLMVSSKFLHDDGEEDEVFIDEWANSGGISTKKLINLEKEFLNAMNWEVFISEHVFWKKLGELESQLAKKEGLNRGWFTYTELKNLLITVELANLIQTAIHIISILLTTYTLGILTLIGSMFIVSNIPGNCLSKTAQIEYNKLLLPIDNDKINDTDVSLNLEDLNDTNQAYVLPKAVKPLDAADVFKTGIILASIKTVPNSKRNLNKIDHNEEEVESNTTDNAWAWWLNPAMDWLTKTSNVIENFNFIPKFKYFIYDRYINMSTVNYKIINLEDQIHKATKVRIQDQMERSWHVEWTDTLKNIFSDKKLFTCW